jgi:hypothetical protein
MMDSTELDVVLLLDVSGSMCDRTHEMAEATWAIRMAVDDLEGSCTVITFDSGPHRILANTSQRPDGRMFVPTAMGGTTPASAIEEGFRLIASSTAKNRLFVIQTDGAWFSNGHEADLIRALGQLGVTTVMVGLGNWDTSTLYGCQFGALITDQSELARLFRRIAAERFRSWR